MTRRRRLLLIVLPALLIGGPVIAELVLRFGLGLGDSPYVVSDPQVEYRFAPSETYHRRGNAIR